MFFLDYIYIYIYIQYTQTDKITAPAIDSKTNSRP